MIKAVIYPIKAEPVLPESEREGTPQPFQWFYPLSEPVLPPTPINVGASFVVDPTELLQRIGLDKWFKQTEEPVRRIPRSLAALLSDGVFVGEPSDFGAVFDPATLGWVQPVDEPVLPRPPVNVAESTIDPTTLLPRITVDRWFKQTEEPVRQVKRSLAALLSDGAIDPTTLLQRVGLDKWFKELEAPVRQVPRSLAALLSDGAFVGNPDDFIDFDPSELQWFRAADEPLRLVRPINVGASFAVDPLTYNPQGLQWFRPTGEPVRVTAKSLAALLSDGVFVGEPGGFFVYDPAEMQWFRLTGEPVRTTPINPSAIMGGTDGNVDILPAPPVVDALIRHRGFTQNVGKMVG